MFNGPGDLAWAVFVFIYMTVKQLMKLREVAAERLRYIDSKIDEALGRTVVKCTNNCLGKGCGKGTQINGLEYIQTYWYAGMPKSTGTNRKATNSIEGRIAKTHR